jgi:hypothetical protein
MRTPKLSVTIGRCGRCGRPLRIGRPHTCLTRLARKPRSGGTKLQPKARLSFGKCPTCTKEITSWPHTCTVTTDFRKRKAEADKQEKAAQRKTRRRRDEHPPASECQDDDCPRYPCVQARIAYQRGRAEGESAGYGNGHAAGYQDGHGDGYQAGFAAGKSAAG